MSIPEENRSIVVLPGGGYGVDGPLLMFAREAAELRGARIHLLPWQRLEELRALPNEEWAAWAEAQARDHTADLVAQRPVLVGKSLGTYAAAIAADHGLPAIWLTPLLHIEVEVAALRRASAPMLLVGGTKDPAWNGALARELSPYVVEVPDADHGMFVPGPLALSAAVLGEVATAIEEFLDKVWELP
ncbi:MAG: alpha/beta hydrolase [Hamadaea sp.]|nr:alpha/beta hydrolase [Hamadaea sp.]